MSSPKPKKQPQPLDLEQINMAKEIIKETHPLNETKLHVAFPILKPCGPCIDKKKATESAEPLLTQKTKVAKSKNMKISEEESKQDPFLLLGFGMIAYRDLLQTFIVLFTILSLLMTPALYYYRYGGYNGYGDEDIGWKVGFTLGNMGYSSVQCSTIPNDINTLSISCPYGQIDKIIDFGVNPAIIQRSDTCIRNENNDLCSKSLISSYQAEIEAECVGKNGCGLNINNEKLLQPDADGNCTSGDARFFVQFTCTQSAARIQQKYEQASLISCLGVFMCGLFLVTIHFLRKNAKIKQLEWDVATITAGDYTVEFKINEEAYKRWYEQMYPEDRDNGISIGESFKAYLKKQIEDLLNRDLAEERSQRKDNEAPPKLTTVKIADIVFAFNNSELIKLLRLRGGHIMYQRFDKMREVEQEISKLKNEKFKDLTRPVGAFITFEEEDAYNLAQKYEPQYSLTGKLLPPKTQFLDEDFYLIPATEPTNIIWENRHFTNKDRFKRTLQVIAIIFILVVISFIIIFTFKSIPIWVNKTWKSVDCTSINAAFSPKNEFYANKEWVERFGTELSDEELENFSMTGALSCFCADTQKKLGFLGARNFVSTENNQICKEFVTDKFTSLFWNQAASNSIIVINYVLRLFIIKLIAYIGKDTESEQTKLIVNGVFIVQFFNTGILLLLVNGNLSEQSSFLGSFINGGIKDFNSQWYQDIGATLIGAMMFNIYWPLIEFFCFWGMRFGFRLLDRGCKCNDTKTKKTTVQQYVELYSGPTYFIHYKYSAILNITFVTFLYGLGLPILFPIAVFAFLTLYLVEKGMIYYSYRQPPLYDDLLNNNALNWLSWAPILFLAFGYWQFSSPQLFGNVLESITYANEPRDSYHYWTQVFSAAGYQMQPAFPLLITFWILLAVQLFKTQIGNLLVRCYSGFKVGDLELDEDIDNYYNCLDDDDRNWSIKEEENCRKVLGIKILQDEAIARLKSTTMGKGHLQGIHTYDILRNPLYLDDFQYFSAAREDREKYIIDDDDDEDNDNAQSDLVRLILNLAFMHEEKAKVFTFSKDAYKSHCKNLLGGLLAKAKIN